MGEESHAKHVLRTHVEPFQLHQYTDLSDNRDAGAMDSSPVSILTKPYCSTTSDMTTDAIDFSLCAHGFLDGRFVVIVKLIKTQKTRRKGD